MQRQPCVHWLHDYTKSILRVLTVVRVHWYRCFPWSARLGGAATALSRLDLEIYGTRSRTAHVFITFVRVSLLPHVDSVPSVLLSNDSGLGPCRRAERQDTVYLPRARLIGPVCYDPTKLTRVSSGTSGGWRPLSDGGIALPIEILRLHHLQSDSRRTEYNLSPGARQRGRPSRPYN
jgi:hypothetical protein